MKKGERPSDAQLQGTSTADAEVTGKREDACAAARRRGQSINFRQLESRSQRREHLVHFPRHLPRRASVGRAVAMSSVRCATDCANHYRQCRCSNGRSEVDGTAKADHYARQIRSGRMEGDKLAQLRHQHVDHPLKTDADVLSGGTADREADCDRTCRIAMLTAELKFGASEPSLARGFASRTFSRAHIEKNWPTHSSERVGTESGTNPRSVIGLGQHVRVAADEGCGMRNARLVHLGRVDLGFHSGV